MFNLDSRLVADTVPIGRLTLACLLLMNDARYPWLILVPQRPQIREIFELDPADQAQLLAEIVLVSRFVSDSFPTDKINVAALGNVVAQLHVHIVGRRRDDPAWPRPVWGVGEAVRYDAAGIAAMRARLAELPGLSPAA